MPKITRFIESCVQCTMPFMTTPYRVSSGRGKFCSMQCYRKSRKGRPMGKPPAERYLERIDKHSSPHGCWLWTGAVGDGYGEISINNWPVTVHRFSWEIHRGPIPEGMWVLHNCPGGDNRLCSNPDHLWLGNAQDNVDDMYAKGRNPNLRKTHCKRGHLFTAENTGRAGNGRRICKWCRNANIKERKTKAAMSPSRFRA